ncbi:MAG TPA: ATP-binding protein [Roseiflexaceae bacterium]|nr:ATP-binding protein [Roseiflexaceae bacterium]
MTSTPPPGAQPPPRNVFRIGLRLGWLASLLVFWQAPALERWAQAALERARATRGDMLADTLGDLAGVVLPVVSSPWLSRVALAGVALLLAELAVGALRLLWVAVQPPRIGGTYLRIRAPRAGVARSAGAAGRAPGDDLFPALHGLLPQGSSVHLVVLLTGRPDQPAELGIQIVGGAPEEHANVVAAVRSLIRGQLPDGVVDERPDALAEALQPGVWLGWREVGLRRGPQYPLRFGDTTERSDLLGPLAVALQPPSGVSHMEVQIVLWPRHDWQLTEGWRAVALRRLLSLKAKRVYSLADEAPTLEAKLHGPAFDTTIRFVAVAQQDQRAAARALDRAVAALGQYNARSGHAAQGLRVIGRRVVQLSRPDRPGAGGVRVQRVRARALRVPPTPTLLWPGRLWRASAILGPDELRGLWHLPSPALDRLILGLPNRILPAPAHAFIPPGANDRIVLGVAYHSDGTLGPVGPTLRDFTQIGHKSGGMGAGKSREFANDMDQVRQRGHGMTYFEGKPGDEDNLANYVRKLLPLADERRLVILNPLDARWPAGINPLARIDLTQPDAVDLALGALDSMLARLDPETWGHAPGMQQYLQMGSLLVLYGEPDPTIAHIKQALLDETYRAKLLQRCPNIEVTTFWEVTFPQTAATQKASRDALLRRFDMLLVPELTRHIVTTSTFRFEQAIAERWIVLILVPTDRLGNLARALAMLLFQAFVLSAFSRKGTALGRDLHFLFMDEVQELVENAATQDFKRALTQLRSLGVPALYAHQALSQFKDLQDLVLTNAQNRTIPRIIGPDADTYAKLYSSSGVTAADISNQEPDHHYANFLVGGRPTGLFSMQPLPWPEPRVVEVPPARPQRWQTALPDQPDPIDPWLARLVYGAVPNPTAAVAVLARSDTATWRHILARWEALRTTHRQLILDEPGLIPDRFERQLWLSRLLAAQPQILAAAQYQRQRWEVAPDEEQANIAPPPRAARQRASEGGDPSLPAGVVVPVTGMTPDAAEQLPTPAGGASRLPVEQVLRARGRRRDQTDMAKGYDGLGDDE